MKFITKLLKLVLIGIGVIFGGSLLLVGGLVLSGAETISGEELEAQEASLAALEESERKLEEQKVIAEKKKGFHCLSAWDGSLRDDRALKNSLNDPGSYEHVQTSITPVNSDGVHTAFVTFRARNGFGGMVLSKATVIVDNETCNNAVLEIQ